MMVQIRFWTDCIAGQSLRLLDYQSSNALDAALTGRLTRMHRGGGGGGESPLLQVKHQGLVAMSKCC